MGSTPYNKREADVIASQNRRLISMIQDVVEKAKTFRCLDEGVCGVCFIGDDEEIAGILVGEHHDDCPILPLDTFVKRLDAFVGQNVSPTVPSSYY